MTKINYISVANESQVVIKETEVKRDSTIHRNDIMILNREITDRFLQLINLKNACNRQYHNMAVIRCSISLYLISLLFVIVFPIVCIAQDTEGSMDDILSGFDDVSDTKESGDGDDILSGFDDFSDIENRSIDREPAKSSWWELDGILRLGSSYNTDHHAPESGQPDYRGLSKLRATLKLEIPFKLPFNWKGNVSAQSFYDFSYGFKDRSEYTIKMLNLYEKETELREAYISGSIRPNLDIKIGRQITTWGFADYVRVVDVLNPLDNRQPGLINLEDIRLPIAMTRLDYYYKNWSIMGVAVHEVEFNKDPVFNSDFFPADQQPPHEDIPTTNLKNTEFGIAITGAFSGWDIGLYFAHYYNDSMYIDTGDLSNLELRHSLMTMGGIGLNYVHGNWLLRAEAALLDGFEFANVQRKYNSLLLNAQAALLFGFGAPNIPSKTYSRLDAMIGVDYVGFKDTVITLEAVNRHINDFTSALKQTPDFALENSTQYIITYTGDMLRDSLHLGAQFSLFGSRGHQGITQRYSVDYDLYDDVTLNLGILTFHGGHDFQVMKAFKENDRIFFGIKYSF